MKNYSIDKKAILRNAVPLFIISGMLILFSLPFITIGVKSIISNYKYTEYTDVLEYNLTGNNNLAEYKYKHWNTVYGFFYRFGICILFFSLNIFLFDTLLQ